jgi:hypothetical protein
MIGISLNPLGTFPLFGLLYQPRLMNGDECEAVGGMSVVTSSVYWEEKCEETVIG